MAEKIQRILWITRKSPATLTGLGMVLVVVLLAVLAPLIAPYGPVSVHFSDRLRPPCSEYLLGTDQFGRDILSRIIYGAQISLLVGVLSSVVSLFFGGLIGLVAAFYGGWLDNLLMRCIDIVMAFPAIVLGVVFMAFFGASLRNVILTIAIVNAPQFARIVRSSVMSVKENEYIVAARSLGAGARRIILQHIVPNSLGPTIVLFTLTIATAIIVEAALSFLGVGIPPPAPSWGRLIDEGRGFMLTAPWISTFPGIAISFSVLGWNLMGDGLRDILDVKIR